MASEVEVNENGDTKGSMWDLDQKLDQPMDEEAGRLKNMYREKVRYRFVLSVDRSFYFEDVLAFCVLVTVINVLDCW